MNIEKVKKVAASIQDENGFLNSKLLIERLNSTSFWELLTETKKIEIPIIQRDYAQGRGDEKTTKLRDKFLDDLIGAIREEEKTLELDFVYGKVEKGVFQPLDGQQRLTTLFLLHWYIALKTNNLSALNKNQFSKFTYETRISSREFCKELVEKSDDLGEGKTISARITDSAWFFLAWKNDPTIKAMLVMLDCIEEKLNDEEDYKRLWGKLKSKKPPITFHFKELNSIGLTDDLYIKMNARGIPLTDFENFKASFEQYIEEKGWENGLEDEKIKEKFAHKIDTLWTDLFWKYRDEDNRIDQAFIKFIAGIAMNWIAENTDEDKKNEKETNEKRIQVLAGNPKEVQPQDFETENAFEYLKNCLDIYSNKSEEYNKSRPNKLPLWDFCKDELIKINGNEKSSRTLFSEFIKEKKPTYKQRVLFYAQTQYLLKTNNFDEEKFSDWMRVVRNIVENSTIDSATTFRSSVRLVKEISNCCADIYEHLVQDDNKVESGFVKKQVEEEVLKAELIRDCSNWKPQIHKVEDDDLLKGQIGFLFDFSKNPDNFDYNKFEELSEAFILLFRKIDDSLRLGLLSQGDYPIWDGYPTTLNAHRYSLLNSFNDWETAFQKIEDEGFEKFKFAVKDLLNELGNTVDRNEFLDGLVNSVDNIKDWRNIIFEDKGLLKNCWNKRICLDDDDTLFILNKTNVVGENFKKVDF